ncbi:BON domain-containing protein [Petroclostridium sp. X23]|uniref:BON domain-containing protein n=1 Tax=Petroclostridium sp. X23 TaxID=3045146 RepID=UPI0024AD38A6|nr:BON domain-containing protein [Petroclostridium sp. X23]WHH61182.1 BON domain-containing protein [Petroclostridium sp. X23]
MDKDAKMTKIIKDNLEEKMGASSMDINVEYQNGFVHLSGFVDVLAEKKYAEEILKGMDGIHNIENNLTISMDGELSDNHIMAELDRTIKHSKYASNLRRVSSKVSGGSATLTGAVSTLADEMHAIELARSVRGIKDVASNLDITSSHSYDDATLKNKINQVLSGTRLSIPDIQTDVSNGKVTLKGYVATAKDMELAIELAADVEGVSHVSNRLKIRRL